MQVFVDLDGVLADFDTAHAKYFDYRPLKQQEHVDWALVKAIPDYFRNLPPMVDKDILCKYLSNITPEPIILTGIPVSIPEAEQQKREWVKEHVGPVKVICCLSKEKSLHAKPGDLLIDDWERYKDLWIAKGGRWITHTSAENTIRQLKEIGS